MLAPFSVGIFDDHPVLTEGIRTLLAPHPQFKFAFAAHSKNELLDKLSAQPVDVLLLDVIAPDVTGLELFQQIKKSFPHQKMAAYTTLSSPILVENILNSGATGYLNKRQPGEEICSALLQICQGEKYVPPDYDFLLKKTQAPNSPLNITEREREILLLIQTGKLSKEIAAQLSISVNTVENHRASLFRKFEVKNVVELVRQAARLGFIDEN